MQRVTTGRRLAAKSWGWLDAHCGRRQNRDQPEGSAPARRIATLDGQMRDQQLDLEVGRRVHLLVGLAIERGLGARDLVPLAAEVFTTWPTTRALAPSARLRCVTTAATYLARCRPRGFQLVGIEEPLGLGVADLVWSKEHHILVDELKTGRAAPNDPGVHAQVARFVEGGRVRWGGRFVGVRVLPLVAVRSAWLMRGDGAIEVPIGAGQLEVH